jgi:UPF0288 family protein (methanogenesis marker protein 3)
MRCAICGNTVETIDEAVEGGWTPYFYDGETEHDPACPNCVEALLQMGEDGEMEVKEEYQGKIRFLKEPQPDPFGEHLLLGVAV